VPARYTRRRIDGDRVAMCFSATASIIAGTALCAAGAATLRMTTRRAEIPFAMIPLLFGLQQLVEGLIWLSFGKHGVTGDVSLTLVYSLFSHVLWPIYVPFAVGLLETVSWRKKVLAICQIIGVSVGLYLLYFIIQFPVTSRVLGRHIVYESPHFHILVVIGFYLIATCVSSLLSSNKTIRLFGALSLITFLAAYAIQVDTLVSVWCFFAAILSFIVYFYFRQKRVGSSRASRTTARATSCRPAP
jgi:hypothetical protein